MSLRMDDINQKENAMKLSMQTVDFRLAKLEEVVLQTAESLFSVQQVQVVSGCLSAGEGVGDLFSLFFFQR